MRSSCRLLAKAQDWLAWAGSAAKSRAPLKRMREVLHAGLRLGVEVPQVDELRLEIRRREWEEQAKKVPACSPPDFKPLHKLASSIGVS